MGKIQLSLVFFPLFLPLAPSLPYFPSFPFGWPLRGFEKGNVAVTWEKRGSVPPLPSPSPLLLPLPLPQLSPSLSPPTSNTPAPLNSPINRPPTSTPAVLSPHLPLYALKHMKEEKVRKHEKKCTAGRKEERKGGRK